MIRYLFIFITGAGLTACSFGKHTFVSADRLAVDTSYVSNRAVDSIIAPYKLVLDREMNEIIARAEVNFINQRPSGNLGNLAADIMLEAGREHLHDSTAICLLNFGGLRSPFSQGNITLGDAFKVMPFDNQLVLVQLPGSTLDKIRDYLLQSGGEPIAGFKIRGQEILDAQGRPWKPETFWVITSDYLLNGGDRMTFFQDQLQVVQTGFILRDLLITYLRRQGTLGDRTDKRIQL
jgi:2',3'-cyclic-nucleotide 2'-phosphodiesterase (5'-nucleotidase family)